MDVIVFKNLEFASFLFARAYTSLFILANDIDDFANFVEVFSSPGPPNSSSSLVSSHDELVVLVNLIADDTVELLEGLTAPDTGERRSAALDSFNSNLDLFISRIEQTVASTASS